MKILSVCVNSRMTKLYSKWRSPAERAPWLVPSEPYKENFKVAYARDDRMFSVVVVDVVEKI